MRLAALFYLAHILCAAWIGTAQGFLALGVIAAAVAVARGELSVPLHRVELPLGLFLLASTLSALVAELSLTSLHEVGEWLNFLTFPLALALYLRHPSFHAAALKTIASLGLFMATWGLIQYFILGHRDLEHRIRGPAAHVMTYSGILLVITLLMLTLAAHRKGGKLFLLSGVLTSAAILLTLTRGAWLGWLAGMMALVLLRKPRGLLFAAPILVLALTLSPLELFGRMVSTFDLEQPSNLDRVRMVEAGIRIIRDYPLFGVGPGEVEEVYPFYRAEDAPRFRIPHLHNNPVQIWAERGALALAAYVLLVGLFLAECLKVPRGDPGRPLAEGGIVAVIGITVAGLFEFNFGDSEVLMSLLDVMAVVCAARLIGGSIPEGASSPAAPAAN
ncbi:MAG TPA: O-antigen ligase family protein [Thermoanaerobaculia bacterium]|nr:O-antigen ligase family protein [Thermoanaerobaculia bacterium]